MFAGADVTDPEQHLPALVEQFNRSAGAPFSAQFGIPSEYEALIEKSPMDRPVLRGELNPVFQGAYSTRIELKHWMRDLERTLTSGEKASVLANRLSATDREALERAWEPVLFNQTHDLTSGVMMDRVYEDTLAGYRHAKRLGDEILDVRLEEVLSRADTQAREFHWWFLIYSDGRGPTLPKSTSHSATLTCRTSNYAMIRAHLLPFRS